MKRLKELLLNKHFGYLNIFFRDILIAILLIYINIRSNFNSWWVAFLTGMFVTWVTWHFQDFLNYEKFKNGFKFRTSNNTGNSTSYPTLDMEQDNSKEHERKSRRN